MKMRKTWLMMFLLLLICYGCAVPLKNSNFNDGKEMNSALYMNQLLQRGERVSLFILGGQIYSQGKLSLDWKNTLQNGAEEFWLNAFKPCSMCSIVNRSYLQNNIDEIALSSSGMISDSTRIKIGELTGATHLLLIEGNDNSNSLGYQAWTVYWKLIDIKTGKLMTIDKSVGSKLNVI